MFIGRTVVFYLKTICEKKYEIAACIINVWGCKEICREFS